MKKIFVIAILALMTVTASAQLITSSRVSRGEKAHNWWVDLGAGGFTGDAEDSSLGLDLGLRYTKMWGNFGWDIIKISATTDVDHFSEALDLQVKTGARYVSPEIFGNMKAYVNAGIGYGLYPDNTDNKGLAWEVGAGIMITPRISGGIVYNNQHYTYENEYYNIEKGINIGFIGVRFGFAL